MKTHKEQKIIIKQVSRKLEDLRPFKEYARGVPSWINYIRLGPGMSLSQLAQRVGVAQSSLSNSIKLEQEGRISIGKLNEIAEAMDCDLVYELVTRKKLEDILKDQVKKNHYCLWKKLRTT